MSKGFPNLGNTCYMNASLKCLSHIPELKHDSKKLKIDINKRSKNNDDKIMFEWIKLQKDLWEDNQNSIANTQPLLREFIKRCSSEEILFNSFEQNDTNDFLNTFIDFLHGSIKRKVNFQISGEPKNQYDKFKLESLQSWKRFFENDYSCIITDLNSKLISLLSCPECNYITSSHEPVMTLTLTLKEEYNTLYDCLNEYTREEKLDKNNTWICEKCKNKVQPNKQLIFWELSPVLIISIKRYRKNMKVDKYINFPEVLNMKEYCLNSKNNDINYELIGICIHSGGLNGGHYYAACKNVVTGSWNTHNDTSVTPTNIESVKKENPYCLFYRKI
mgnify:CR=1 FL=1